MTGPPVVAIGRRGLAARHAAMESGTFFGFSRIGPGDSLDWLPEALVDVREALQLGGGDVVDWLILRPLALGKVLELPPVRAGALRALATANIGRFFPVAAAAWSADALPLERSRNQPRRTLVTALPQDVLGIVEEATRAAGLKLGRIVPAPAAAALQAARLVDVGGCPRTCLLEFPLPGYTEVVRLEGGVASGLIPLPARDEPGLRGVLEVEAPACSVLGRDWPLALEIATMAGTRRQVTEPLTGSQMTVRRRRARRHSGMLAIATCLAVLIASGLQLAGESRELNSLRHVRSALAPDVAQALRQRSLLQGLESSVRELSAAEASRSDWPRLFRDLAASLPASAHVTRVSGHTDSLTLAITTDDVSVLDALRSGSSSFRVEMQEATSGPEVRVVTAWRPNAAHGGPDAD